MAQKIKKFTPYKPKIKKEGKEFFVECVATDIAMCFTLKSLGSDLSKEDNNAVYFTSTNENFWLNKAKDSLKKAKDYEWSTGEYKEIYKKNLGSSMVEVSQGLRRASERGLIKREKWGKVLKEFFALYKEMMAR